MSDTLHVFVLEDDTRTRESLLLRLEIDPGLSIAGAVGSLAAARAALQDLHVDVFLFDLQLPDGNAVELIEEQQRVRPDAPILVISVFGDEDRVIGAIEAGAQGYLLKDDAGEDLVESIRRAVAGESPISPAIARHLIRRFQKPSEDTPDATAPENPLSEREIEVLRLASKGMTYQETASLLKVSVNTVGTYTRRIYQKLAVSSRAQALFEARQLGLMRGDE